MLPSISGSTVSPNTRAKIHVIVSHLPEAIHSGLSFFEACLEEKVIIVPGLFPNTVFTETDLFIQGFSSTSILRIDVI